MRKIQKLGSGYDLEGQLSFREGDLTKALKVCCSKYFGNFVSVLNKRL